MKNTDLRIGNSIYYQGEEIIVTPYTFTDIEVDAGYEPIPLTKEWLLKFGFEKTHGIEGLLFVRSYKNEEFDYFEEEFFIGYTSKNEFYYQSEEDSDFVKRIKYVHQLQNLFFALAGEEL